MRYIQRGDETMILKPNGQVVRPGKVEGSDTWIITGAVSLNNFGHITHHYSLAEVLELGPAIPWWWKNGAQRTHLTDLDHGTHRMWRSPRHRITS